MIDIYFNATPMLGPRTGIGNYCLGLTSSLRLEKNVNVQYFNGKYWEKSLPGELKPRDGKFKRKGIVIAERFPSLASNLYLLNRYLENKKFSGGIIEKKGGVYHEPGLLSFKSRLPTILTVHDLSVSKFPDLHPDYRVKIFDKLFKSSLERADCIVTDSEFVRRELLDEYKVNNEQVISVKIAASEIYKPKKDQEIDKQISHFGLKAGSYILTVGTLEPRKNIETVVRAYSRLPKYIRQNIPLVIVGMFGWKQGQLLKEIRELREQGQIILLGFVENEMMPYLYSGAKLFVYASKYEGFGLPPLEAMSCGVPVIVSDTSAIPEVVGNAGILCDVYGVEEFTEAFQNVIEDLELHNILCSASLKQAAKFDWGNTSREMKKIYQGLSK